MVLFMALWAWTKTCNVDISGEYLYDLKREIEQLPYEIDWNYIHHSAKCSQEPVEFKTHQILQITNVEQLNVFAPVAIGKQIRG